MHCVSTLKNIIAATSKDLQTCGTIWTKGWPADLNQKNEIILAALRILSVRMIAGATIIAFSATYFRLETIHKIISIGAATVIIFHDIYVGSSNISYSLANHRFIPTDQTDPLNGKLVSQALLEGSTGIAKELTRGMWAFNRPLVIISNLWAPSVAKRFYNATISKAN